MSFREKWEKLGRTFPRRAERNDNLHTSNTTPVSSGFLSSTPKLGFLTPLNTLRRSSWAPQSAISSSATSYRDSSVKDFETGPETRRLTIWGVNDEPDWVGAKAFQSMLCQTPDSPLKSMVDEFIQCIDIFERIDTGSEHRKLKNELDLLFQKLGLQLKSIVSLTTPSVENLCRSICRKLCHIRDRQDGGTMKWYLRIGAIFEPDEVLLDYRRIRGELQQIWLNVDTTIWPISDNRVDDFLLECLRPSISAKYDSSYAAALRRGACTSGTRTSELARMLDWIRDPETSSTYWLSGMAGTGKTTIIYSLCEQLSNERLLAGCFFCSRSLPECREVDRIMASIAYQLAQFSHPFRCALADVLRKDPGIPTKGVATQFQYLIVNPLVRVQETMPEGVVVIIDALDECEDEDCTDQILDALLNRSSHLPVKFIASSRPEPIIQKRMDAQRGKRVKFRLLLHEIDQAAVKTDIEEYLRQALAPANPSDQQIATLVQHAGVLFVYAATIVRHVIDAGPTSNLHGRLETLLDNPKLAVSEAENEIDALYTTILELAIDNPRADATQKADKERVLGIVICSHEQMTIDTISFILGMDRTRVHTALQSLTSVLFIWGASQVVTILHASFLDFMLDPQRSRKYCCRKRIHQEALTLGCFRWLRENRPQFNICGLKSAYIRDGDVPDLKSRVDEAVSWELCYACQYWAAHLENTCKSAQLLEALVDFLSSRLMLWIEVMNLKNLFHAGPEMLWRTGTWINAACGEDVVQLAHCAWQFTTDYYLGAAKLSTPHIYQSMLFYLSPSSPLGKHYTKRMRRLFPYDSVGVRPKIDLFGRIDFDEKLGAVEWSPNGTRIIAITGSRVVVINPATRQIVLEKTNDHSVAAIAISPNSNQCATGWGRCILELWDLRDGKSVLGPLVIKGTKSAVITATRYSPDGSLIACGFSNGSIHMLDAKTGRPNRVLSPPSQSLYSRRAITSLQFSPTGNHIATAVSKEGIAIWDARTGEQPLIPPGGPNYSQDLPTPFRYSPDGICIAFGLNERVHVWHLGNGRSDLGPLTGHTEQVTSVAYSPDGCRIISGSDDGSIRGWDSQTGQLIIGPFSGHTGQIVSIDYSPNGARIVFSSRNNTIGIWDVGIGRTPYNPGDQVLYSPDSSYAAKLFGPPEYLSPQIMRRLLALDLPEEYTDTITSVGYSPDDTRIATGSCDGTIQIWDAETGEWKLRLQSYTEFRRPILSVVYSPEGDLLISCDEDGIILIWNPHNSKAHGSPLARFEVGQDRWITDNNSRLISWLPPNLPIRELLQRGSIIYEIVADAISLVRGYGLIEKSWSDCYKPE